MTKIKLVAFDLEGVLIDWNSALFNLQVLTDVKKENIHEFLIKYLPEIESGKINSLELWGIFKKQFSVIESVEEINECWVKGHKRYQGSWEYAKELKKLGIKIAICTNTWTNFVDSLKKLNPDYEIFDYIFDSTKIGFKKPQKEFFEYVENTTGFKGKEIMLIDDSEENLEGAEDYGWRIYDGNLLNDKLSNKYYINPLSEDY